MQLVIDTQSLTDADISLLRVLVGAEAPVVKAEESKPAPAKKAAAAPAKKAAPKPEPEPEDEDLLGGEAPTKKDALEAASKLVADGKSSKVKEALAAVGVARVSGLEDDQVQAFLDALED